MGVLAAEVDDGLARAAKAPVGLILLLGALTAFGMEIWNFADSLAVSLVRITVLRSINGS